MATKLMARPGRRSVVATEAQSSSTMRDRGGEIVPQEACNRLHRASKGCLAIAQSNGKISFLNVRTK